MNKIGPLYLQVLPTVDQKYFLKNSRKFHKAKLEFAICQQYLHSIYTILSVISNLEMILSICEKENTMIILYKELERS